MDELEKAHNEYMSRKVRVLRNLEMLFNNTDNVIVKEILKEAIEFVNEREV